MIKHYRIRDYDFKLIFFVVALTIIGILAIGSAKESVQTRQIAGFIVYSQYRFADSCYENGRNRKQCPEMAQHFRHSVPTVGNGQNSADFVFRTADYAASG